MSDPPPDAPARRCAICGKAQVDRFKPFCSKRCADIDLSRWLKGVYAIASEKEANDAADNEPDDA